MIFLRRILASRANGARSIGPVTPDGKRQSSLNALRHGLLAECLVLPDESADGFAHIAAQYIERLGPLDEVEFGMVEEMVAALWRIRRSWAIENQLLAEGVAAQPEGDDVARITASFRDLASGPQLALLQRCETRLHTVFQRALHNILLLRAAGLPNEPSSISEHSAPPWCGRFRL